MTGPTRQPSRPSDAAAAAQPADLTRLLRSAAAGDDEAWRQIVGLYARRVYALARSRLCPRIGPGEARSNGVRRNDKVHSADHLWSRGHDIAEEVTQSVFVTIATKLSSGEYSEQGRFESWLFRVAMNRIRDEARRARRHAQPTDPETLDGRAGGDDSGTSSSQSDPDQFIALRRAMHELSDQDREVIELRHHAGLSFKQIADHLNEPLGTLLARHHRALRKLKEIMTGPAGEPAHTTGSVS